MRSKQQVPTKERRAAIKTLAAALQGSVEAGEVWLKNPAIGLDNRQRPLDLLHSLEGAEKVEELLSRLEHGVYS